MSWEELSMWAKDIAAGAGLIAFVACSFALATVAQAMFAV
jgi:diacylglycerol kinase